MTKKQQKQAKDIGTLKREYGQRGILIAKCLNILVAVKNLDELLRMPKSLNQRCHELHGNLKEIFSMDLVHPYRLLFEPKPPIPRREDGGIAYREVICVSVVSFSENTHE